MPSRSPLITLEKVSKWYGDRNQKISVLHNLTLSINKGEFAAIVGPSGSGKTTLAHLIGGILRPNEGSLLLNGHFSKDLSDTVLSRYRNEEVGFVFQNFSLIPHFTATENVTLPLVVRGIPLKQRKLQAEALLKNMGLGKRLATKADALSGGERQRVAIARALITNPAIIIADEPTGSLDSRRGLEILAELKKLHQERGITVLVVTHDSTVAQQADRILQLYDGKLKKETYRASA